MPELNYLELINNYWDLREQGILLGSEGEYYLFLIHKCNRLAWKNPFNLSNQLCCGYLGIQEKSLIKYRNKLKQVGLIDFKSGHKGSNTEYWIHSPKACNIYSETGSLSGSHVGSLSGSLPVEKAADNIKPKQKETIPEESKSHSGATAPMKNGKSGKGKKVDNETPTEHWQQLVLVWFNFNQEKFKEKPTFKGADPRYLRTILDLLKSRAAKKAVEWTQENAVSRFKVFLEMAYLDDWLSKNFLLKNLESQFDKVILDQATKAAAPKQPQVPKPAGLPKLAVELNYLYSRFLEDESKVTILSIETVHYDFLKKHQLMDFPEGLVTSIHEQAINDHPECATNEDMLKKRMKRFGVLEFFKIMRAKNTEVLFRQ